MNDVTRKLKDKAITATMEYNNQLLEDFLAHAKNFQKVINDLLENGKTEDGYFCLDNACVGASVIFNRTDVEKLHQLLATLNNDNALPVFNSILEVNPYFTVFPDCSKMHKLEHEILSISNLLKDLFSD